MYYVVAHYDVWLALAEGLALGILTTWLLVRVMPRLQFKQTAYEDAPETHKKKTGTPTMGGIAFVVAMLPLIALRSAPIALALLFLIVACAAIGFIDDYLAIRRGKNLGLRARTKYLASALVAVTFLNLADGSGQFFPHDVLFSAGTFVIHAPHWLWLLLGIIAVTGTMHAVNLTDGLDGLATGTVIPPLVVLAMIGSPLSPIASMAAVLGVGACLGFLIFNRYPAKIFMGDTGSLALGALLAGAAILEGQMLLLILICIVPVAETLSVIIQVTYFKATKGKRVFKMTPLHHHFELLGWPETKVTRTFWAASLIASAIGLAIVR
jgi:phospho-N-acetylmuramoyl-pentapeptide-transferase